MGVPQKPNLRLPQKYFQATSDATGEEPNMGL